MSDFLYAESDESVEVLNDVVEYMKSEFALSRSEAVARVNEFFSNNRQLLNSELLTHELPSYWAMQVYYGDVPDWDPKADRSQWKPISVPPLDSKFWTA